MIEIIPAIDIMNGECVRLSQGDYSRKTSYSKDVVAVARSYEDIGVRRLHMVDLDGARASSPCNLGVLEAVAAATSLDIQYGGGIKSAQALGSVLDAGASRAICGSVAVTRPELMEDWLAEFGPGRIVLGADIKDGVVATHGWLESSRLGVDEVIERFLSAGLSQVICTDISRDGMLQGPSFPLYERLQAAYPAVEITVSGGIGSLDDILALDGMGLRNVIVGKAVYEGRITMKQLEECLRNA